MDGSISQMLPLGESESSSSYSTTNVSLGPLTAPESSTSDAGDPAIQSHMDNGMDSVHELPPLLRLPAEIYGIIAHYLPQCRDINKLCLSCKHMNASMQPHLYGTLQLKVPVHHLCLSSLEGLLGSAGEGLQHTTHVAIATRMTRYQNEDEGDGSYQNISTYLPNGSLSTALNMLIRSLIMRIPRGHLRYFYWLHNCVFELATLNLLKEFHGTSLANVGFERFEKLSSHKSIPVQMKMHLTSLRASSIDLSHDNRWLGSLIAYNSQTLRELYLGRRSELAYPTNSAVNNASLDTLTKDLIIMIEEEMKACGRDPDFTLQLVSLGLYGLAFDRIVRGEGRCIINLSKIRSLSLGSCSGVSGGFSTITQVTPGLTDGKTSSKLSSLKFFRIRQEGCTPGFQLCLEQFLCSLPRLRQLYVLLEGCTTRQLLRPILKKQGKYLRSLIWDERRAPRTSTTSGQALLSKTANRLGLISTCCPKLLALGTTLDWNSLLASTEYQNKITASFKDMSQLETFNIRNLPTDIHVLESLPDGCMLQNVAAVFVNFALTMPRGMRPFPSLRTIAVGAPRYTDLFVGGDFNLVHTPEQTRVHDLLRLRIYRIDYRETCHGDTRAVLDEIATGVYNDAIGFCGNGNIFHGYWLC